MSTPKKRQYGLKPAPASRSHNVLCAWHDCPIVPPEILAEWLDEHCRMLQSNVAELQAAKDRIGQSEIVTRLQAASEVLNALDFLDLAETAQELLDVEMTPREAQAMTVGLRLGMLRERLQSLARDDFHRAWKASDRGAKGAATTNEDAIAMQPLYVAAVQKLLKQGKPIGEARAEVAKKAGVTERTVREHTKHLGPGKAGRPPKRK